MALMPLLLLVFTTRCLAAGTPIDHHPVMNITAVQHENVSLPSTIMSISDTLKFSGTERHLLLFEYKQNEMVFNKCGQRCTILIELTPILHNIQLNDSGPYRLEWYPYPLIPNSVKHLDIYLHVTEGPEPTTPNGTTAASPALYTAGTCPEPTTPDGTTSAAPALYTAGTYLPAVFQVLVAIGSWAIMALMA